MQISVSNFIGENHVRLFLYSKPCEKFVPTLHFYYVVSKKPHNLVKKKYGILRGQSVLR